MNYAEKAAAFRNATAVAFSSAAEAGTIPHEKAAEHPDMFRPWAKDTDYLTGNICRDESYMDGTYIFTCRSNHTSQEIYPPHTIPALWERIPKPGEGTHDNPIPYDAAVGMALVNGKFYIEDNVTYECFRDTGVPVYNHLADLINIYVMVSN